MKKTLILAFGLISDVLVRLHLYRLRMCILHLRYLYDAPTARGAADWIVTAARELGWGVLDFAIKRRHCPVCGWSGYEFSPEMMGGNYRPATRCPKCLTFERHRLTFKYIKDNKIDLGHALFVGPNLAFARTIAPSTRHTLDIYPHNNADVVGDITCLPFKDGALDSVFCLRVLEHVKADRAAMASLRRVIKPTGALFLSVPIYDGLAAAVEYPTINQDRSQGLKGPTWYCPDHWRDYTADEFERRLSEAGFAVTRVYPNPADPTDRLMQTSPRNDRTAARMGFTYTGVLFVCRPK